MLRDRESWAARKSWMHVRMAFWQSLYFLLLSAGFLGSLSLLAGLDSSWGRRIFKAMIHCFNTFPTKGYSHLSGRGVTGDDYQVRIELHGTMLDFNLTGLTLPTTFLNTRAACKRNRIETIRVMSPWWTVSESIEHWKDPLSQLRGQSYTGDMHGMLY